MCVLREMDYCVKEDLLYNLWHPVRGTGMKLRLVVPESLQKTLITNIHASTLMHLGAEKVIEVMRERFIFMGVYPLTEKIVGSCRTCLLSKGRTRTLQPGPGLYEVADNPFERCHMDFMGPLPQSCNGHRYICICADSLSGFIIAWPQRTLEASALAENFHQRGVCT